MAGNHVGIITYYFKCFFQVSDADITGILSLHKFCRVVTGVHVPTL